MSDAVHLKLILKLYLLVLNPGVTQPSLSCLVFVVSILMTISFLKLFSLNCWDNILRVFSSTSQSWLYKHWCAPSSLYVISLGRLMRFYGFNCQRRDLKFSQPRSFLGSRQFHLDILLVLTSSSFFQNHSSFLVCHITHLHHFSFLCCKADASMSLFSTSCPWPSWKKRLLQTVLHCLALRVSVPSPTPRVPGLFMSINVLCSDTQLYCNNNNCLCSLKTVSGTVAKHFKFRILHNPHISPMQ